MPSPLQGLQATQQQNAADRHRSCSQRSADSCLQGPPHGPPQASTVRSDCIQARSDESYANSICAEALPPPGPVRVAQAPPPTKVIDLYAAGQNRTGAVQPADETLQSPTPVRQQHRRLASATTSAAARRRERGDTGRIRKYCRTSTGFRTGAAGREIRLLEGPPAGATVELPSPPQDLFGGGPPFGGQPLTRRSGEGCSNGRYHQTPSAGGDSWLQQIKTLKQSETL